MATFKRLTVSGEVALVDLDRLRAERSTTGLCPILMGDEDELEILLEDMEGVEPAEVTLARARETDGAVLLARWWRTMAEGRDEDEEDMGEDPTRSESWPKSEDEPEAPGIITHLEGGGGGPLAAVVIGLFPVAELWEVFAHLGRRGWNS